MFKKQLYFPFYTFLIFLFFLLSIYFIYTFLLFKKVQEPFCNWSPTVKQNFLTFQSTINPLSTFDMNIIQQQATEQEAEQFLKNGFWPWSKETDYLYMDAIGKEKIMRLTPGLSLQAAKKIYNENAIKQLLSWNTKEGQFILNGGFSNINTNKDFKKQIKCFSNVNGPSSLHSIQVDGYNLWNGYKKEKITKIKKEDIPKEMPGFSFVHEPCNPCAALELDYSCPFQLNVKGDNSISDIWKQLWHLT